MVAKLAEAIPSFPGSPNQVRCFAHIINLVAKTVLRQFDAGKDGKMGDQDTAAVLAEVVAGLDLDQTATDDGDVDVDTDTVEELDNDVDGWVDERTDLSEEEREELRDAVLPVKLILNKVSADRTCLRSPP